MSDGAKSTAPAFALVIVVAALIAGYVLVVRNTGDETGAPNRDAIGAVVRLWVGKTAMVRQVNPAGGYLAHSSRVVHFGLGDQSKVDRIEIRWPRGIVQTLDNPGINTLHQIREPAQ